MSAHRHVIAAAAALLMTASTALAQDVAPPDASRSVISSQIEAFRAGDNEKAFSFAAPGIRRAFGSSDAFISMVKRGYRPVFEPQSVEFGRFSERGGNLFQEVLVTGPAGKNWVALYTLRRQSDGSLRITGVRLAESESLGV